MEKLLFSPPSPFAPKLHIPTVLCNFSNHQASTRTGRIQEGERFAVLVKAAGLKIGKVKIIFCWRCNERFWALGLFHFTFSMFF